MHKFAQGYWGRVEVKRTVKEDCQGEELVQNFQNVMK